MKKTLSLLATSILGVAFLLAQDCTIDDSYTSPGIYPDTVQNLDTALVDVYFEQVLQVKALTDTTVDLGAGDQNIPVNWIRVDGVSGLPTGFSYSCNPSNCIFPGGSNGCVVLYGTAVDGQEGAYPITVNTTGEVVILFGSMEVTEEYPIDIAGYVLVVNGPNGINKHENSFLVYQEGDNYRFNFLSKISDLIYNLYDVNGRRIASNSLNHTESLNISTELLPRGLYILQMELDGNLISYRLIK